jgi:excinuclease UvrABC nuclease subunit
MPIAKRWSSYKETEIPEERGVYELGWQGYITYIGRAKNVRKRIRDHYNDHCDHAGETCNFHQVRYITEGNCERVFSYREKELYEQLMFKRENGRFPKYNSKIG